MADLACRTSLINGGYFNIHTIKLPLETYSRYEKKFLIQFQKFDKSIMTNNSENVLKCVCTYTETIYTN
jgi:hypothetical protein